jgi:hypothetical protein
MVSQIFPSTEALGWNAPFDFAQGRLFGAGFSTNYRESTAPQIAE